MSTASDLRKAPGAGLPDSLARRIRSAAVWPLVAFVAYIFLWYLQYKFTGDRGSVWLFTVLTDWLGVHGHEKFMRIAVGSMELTAVILLLIRPAQIFGATLALGIMTGAIFFHSVSPLGIDPYGDGGVLFKQACATWLCALAILVLRSDEIAMRLRRLEPHLPPMLRPAAGLARRGAMRIDRAFPG